MSAVITALRTARGLVADEESWCRGTFARDKGGSSVDERGPEACSWCMLGALRVACLPAVPRGDAQNEVYNTTSAKAARRLAFEKWGSCVAALNVAVFGQPAVPATGGLATWQDKATRTHAEVVEAFDMAIEAAAA